MSGRGESRTFTRRVVFAQIIAHHRAHIPSLSGVAIKAEAKHELVEQVGDFSGVEIVGRAGLDE